MDKQFEIDVTSISKEFIVPDGGKSLPIIFDFEGKMPESDITITGYITQSDDIE